jgi:hypothetical protein
MRLAGAGATAGRADVRIGRLQPVSRCDETDLMQAAHSGLTKNGRAFNNMNTPDNVNKLLGGYMINCACSA